MSMSFLSKNNFLSFKEFLLTEAIKPTKIEYGINDNFDDEEWITKTSSNGLKLHYTFIHRDNFYYFVSIRSDFDIGFATSRTISISKIQDIDYIEDEFLLERVRDTKNILKFFGNMAYVMLKGLHKFNMKKAIFSGHDPELGVAYKTIVTNKFFQKNLEEYGFMYSGKEEANFVFVKS